MDVPLVDQDKFEDEEARERIRLAKNFQGPWDEPTMGPMDADIMAAAEAAKKETALDWAQGLGKQVAADSKLADKDITGNLIAGEMALSMLPESPRMVVDGLLPAGRLHLVAGPSGGGKTTITFQLYKNLMLGEPFMGRATTPVKWAYVSGDRTAGSVYDTLRRLELYFPVFSLVDENLVGEDLISKIIPRLPGLLKYRPDFIYIDGFTSLVPGGHLNNYSIVAKWLAQLQRFAAKMNITILGACHTTKVKEGEKFTNPRQRVAGSVAWAGFSDTVILIEPTDDPKKPTHRSLGLLPRNGAEEFIELAFNDKGQLAKPDDNPARTEEAQFLFDNILEQHVQGEEMFYMKLKALALKSKLALRTLDFHLDKAIQDGRIRRVRKGIYMLVGDTTPGETDEATETLSQVQ